MSEPSAVLCRYYANGCCSKGQSCQFSHDRSTANTDNVCRFYLKGHCTYANKCRYDHVKPPSAPAPPPSPPAFSPAAGPSPAGPSSSTASVSSASKLSAQAPVFVPRALNFGNLENFENLENVDFGAFDVSEEVDPLDANEIEQETDMPSFVDASNASYAMAAGAYGMPAGQACLPPTRHIGSKNQLCPYYSQDGSCFYGDACTFAHGELCEFCLLNVLHPHDKQQRQEHLKTCVKQHELEMEQAFAEAASEDKQCGICMEVVVKKTSKAARRFGILQNCKHIFCLDCIRTWRNQDKFDMGCIRACPECRAPSDFVTPSSVWTDDETVKTKIISDYKTALNKKPCKYFNQGKGECRFGNKCFYKHALPDGTIVQSDSPRTVRRRIKARNGERGSGVPDVFVLWDWMDRDLGDSDDDSDFELELMQERFLEVLDFSDPDSPNWSDTDFDFHDFV